MNFDFTNLRVSGTIGVEDVPLDVLLKVRDYLEGRMKESDLGCYGKLAESIVKATLHPEAQPAEEEADDSGDESETDDPYMRVLNAAIKKLKDSGATYGRGSGIFSWRYAQIRMRTHGNISAPLTGRSITKSLNAPTA